MVQSTHSGRKHFAVLDGLRGIAAVGVVLFHSYQDGGLIPNALVAVDLFFILSGFVVGMAYDDDLRSTMSTKEFILRRIVRLYPMIFVGSAVSIAIAVAHNFTNPSDAHSASELAIAALLSFLTLPYLTNTLAPGVFPFNPVLWSLFFELLVNIVYAVTVRRQTVPIIAALIVVSVIIVALGPRLGGGGTDDFWWGFPRVTCGFFGGLLLAWAYKRGTLRMLPGSFWIVSLALIGVLALPFEVRGWLFVLEYIALAGIIVFAVNAEVSKPVETICSALGQLSYPVYAIHWTTLYVFAFAAKKVGLSYDAIVFPHLIFAIAFSYCLAIFFEKPVCKWLGKRFLPARRSKGREIVVHVS